MRRTSEALLPILFIAGAWLALGCHVRPPDRYAAARLHTATHLSSETRSLISRVLADITKREHRFDANARREALDAVGRLHARGFLPTVREIAAMIPEDTARTRHAEIVAISSALRLLTDLEDDAARALNAQRLHDESFRGFAIQNLKALDAWDTTAAVEAELLTMRMTDANGNEVAAMLDFLIAAPNASASVCSGVARVTAAYPECGRAKPPSAPSFCADLVDRIAELRTTRCNRVN
jgi:phosphohistidine swiveling domain-containing protein